MASMKKGNKVVVWPPPEAYTDDDPRSNVSVLFYYQ